jgi:hypothetical protein
MSNQLQWQGVKPGVTDEIIDLVENRLSVTFPQALRNCVKNYNAGTPVPNKFYLLYPELNRVAGSSLSSLFNFYLEAEYNIVEVNLNPPEFFNEGLIAIGEDGGGDFICLNYFEKNGRDEPTVAYWSHEVSDPNKAVVKLADSFEEFLGMLK